MALSGDKTYNKDRLRAIVKEGSTVIPGASTVSFDRVSEGRIYQAIDQGDFTAARGSTVIPGASTVSFDRVSEGRIYQAIDQGDFTAARFLKDEYLGLRQMLGTIPSLLDFDRNGSIDPLLIFNKDDSFHGFLSRYEKAYDVIFSEAQENILKFVSKKLANGKRADELYLLRALLARDGAFAVVDGFLINMTLITVFCLDMKRRTTSYSARRRRTSSNSFQRSSRTVSAPMNCICCVRFLHGMGLLLLSMAVSSRARRALLAREWQL